MQINKIRATIIALRFFEQYHSDVILKDAIFEDKNWKVIVSIGRQNTRTKQVEIDVNAGKILSVSDFC